MSELIKVVLSIGPIAIITVFLKAISALKATEIEKQLETNNQRTFRDVIYIIIIFISLCSLLICIFGIIDNQNSKNTINFSREDQQYRVSGYIATKNLEYVILKVDNKSYEIEVNKGKYEKKIDGLNGGETYYLLKKSKKEILRGVVPSSDELRARVNQIIVFIIVYLILISIMLYYGFKDSFKKKLMFNKNEGGKEQGEYIVLKSLSDKMVLLQKIERSKNDLYVVKDVYTIIEKSELVNNDLKFETRDEVVRRKAIDTYNNFKDFGKGWSIFLIFIFLSMLIIMIFLCMLITKSIVLSITLALIINLLVFFIIFCYKNYYYHKGKDIIIKEEKEYHIFKTSFSDLKSISKKWGKNV